MSLFARSVVLLCMLSLASAFDPFKPFDEKTRVRIINHLKDNKALRVHCKSGDEDIGSKLLRNNEYFEWAFDINFWGTTLYYCSFNWKGAGSIHWFDIFIYSRDKYTCTDCFWSIREGGLALMLAPSEYSWKYYEWKN